MKLVNIANKDRKIYLFIREDDKLITQIDNDFFPYYYIADPQGKFKSYDGQNVKKVFCTDPKSASKNLPPQSWEGDIRYRLRYLVDKVTVIMPTIPKYCFLDIEVLCTEMPDIDRPIYTISCISIYNSVYDKVKTLFYGDYLAKHNRKDAEKQIFIDLIEYIKGESFDLIFIWNALFDWGYLSNRYKVLFGKRKELAQDISPIGELRRAQLGKQISDEDRNIDDLFFPAGISIIDFLQWFKKLTLNRRRSYALDYIAQTDLGETPWGKEDFSQLSENVKQKNINDVLRMQKLEKKFNIIPYFDEIRRLAKIEWEDLYYNSRIVGALCLQEAKKQQLALPTTEEVEKEEFEGAYKEVFKTGFFENLGVIDLGSAYPSIIRDFCLDSVNLKQTYNENTTEIKIKNKATKEIVNTYYFERNSKAILPMVVTNALTLKDKIKGELKLLCPASEAYKNLEIKYASIKGICNSIFGVCGNRFFKLYKKAIAESTTFLVRDLLEYCIGRVKEELNVDIIYIDTDGLFFNSINDLSVKLNEYIQDWAKQYGITTTLKFESQGYFEKILILSKCRYKGYLRNPNGLKEEVKGIESKRNDSTVFMKKFQETLMDKIFAKESHKSIEQWIESEKERIKTVPITEIAFPVKLGRKAEKYVNKPIFVRALECSNLKKNVGDLFYYIYIKEKQIGTQGKQVHYFNDIKLAEKTYEEILEKANKKVNISYRKKTYTSEEFLNQINVKEETEKIMTNVTALDESTINMIQSEDIDYSKMISRNMETKIKVIFDAMGWS